MQVGVGEEEKQAFLAAAEGRLGGGIRLCICHSPCPGVNRGGGTGLLEQAAGSQLRPL